MRRDAEGDVLLRPLEYIDRDERLPKTDWEGHGGTPAVASRIWREGDIGWVAEIIEAAWARWLEAYPSEWRTVGQAIPYVHLRAAAACDRPKSRYEEKIEDYDIDAQTAEHDRAIADWVRAGLVEPEWPTPTALGHTHGHDHGICLDPWLVDHRGAEESLEGVLMHELAHAIAGVYGHEGEWFSMCEVIGHELTPKEKHDYDGEDWATSDPYEMPPGSEVA